MEKAARGNTFELSSQFPDGIVYAFESVPELFKQLKARSDAMKMDPVLMSCPLCGSKIVYRIVSHSGWAIHACKGCTNAWTVPFPGEVSYIAEDFHASVDELPREWKYCIRRQSELLARYLPKNARILEIGCGEGILLSELSKLGFNVQGIEPSQSGSARARAKGLNVITGSFPQTQHTGPFDAVILSHVLEHLADPTKILESISRIAPQGYLLLIQSHYKGLVPWWDKERWYAWLPEEHFWHFTPEGLKNLSNPLGFDPVACEFSSLVHGQKRTAQLASKISCLFPRVLDQFHLLLKLRTTPAASQEQNV